MLAQGNFSRAEILRWHEDGYFGLDLPVCCLQNGKDSPLRPLGDWMHDWARGGLQLAPPPGFSCAAAATLGSAEATVPSAQTPALSHAAAPHRLQQEHQPRLGDMSGIQPSANSQLYDEHLFTEAVAARQIVAAQSRSDLDGKINHQQVHGHVHNAQYRTAMQALSSGLRSVDASQDVISAGVGSEQVQHQQQHQQQQQRQQQQQQQAFTSRSSAAPASVHAQQAMQHREQQLPPPHYPIQQPEQPLLQPHALPPSLPQQQPALQTELSMGGTPPLLAVQGEGSAVPVLRPRLPAFAQLRAGGSSQDAEQEADVNELIELLRQPVSSDCMGNVAECIACASLLGTNWHTC